MDLINTLLERLDYVNATRAERQAMANEVLGNPKLFKPLLRIAMERADERGQRACWVVEFVCKSDLSRIYPHLEYFTQHLRGLQDESSIRPMAKICEMLALAVSRSAPATAPPLSTPQRNRMIEASFDWLIGPHKVAAKAYSMNTLYYLGREADWVHRELKATIEQHYPAGSAAYQARARQVLNMLKRSP